jgi:predicted dehydrogenase
MNHINWGIIGCGDVAEVKSGPAFSKVKNSSLVAVMRRDGEKAKDFAKRHQVPKWYDNADQLIKDPEVNAIYVATPPSSHEEYTFAALRAGKPVYVEKPMSVDSESAERMLKLASSSKNKLVVAHYRRAQPMYRKIRELIDEKAIGDILFAKSEVYKKPVSSEELSNPGRAWRVDTNVAGGGLFHDISPHQLDLMNYFFGDVERASGLSLSQNQIYKADDLVSGSILFKNRVIFNGIWCFNVAEELEKDNCEIFGTTGKICFSFFEHKPIQVTRDGKTEMIAFDPLPHVQQPMIERVVNYFRGEGPNPCGADVGVTVMQMIDRFTRKD